MDDICEISDEMKKNIEKDIHILKKYATGVDSETLYSMLLSEMHNANRLKLIMSDLLGIPNAQEIIDMHQNYDEETDDEDTTNKQGGRYFQETLNMFPDVDVGFLIKECRFIKSDEDFNKFINTVMLNGTYKKKCSQCHTKHELRNDDTDIVNCRSSESSPSGTPDVWDTSDDEITSSGIVDTQHNWGNKKNPPIIDSRILSPVIRHVTQQAISCLNNAQIGPMDLYESELMDVDPYEGSEDWSSPSEGASSPFDHHSLSDFEYEYLNDNSSDRPSTSRLVTCGVTQTTASLSTQNHCSGFSNLAQASFTACQVPGGARPKKRSAESTARAKVLASAEVSTTCKETKEIGDIVLEESEASHQSQEVTEDLIAEQTAELIRLFPNSDPSFLEAECLKLNGSAEALNEFVLAKLENNDMPSRKEYEKRMELLELQDKYTKNFSIEDFLKVIPDPWTYFSNSTRNCIKYKTHSICFLKSKFRHCFVRDLTNDLMRNDYNLYLTCKELLGKKEQARRRRRTDMECNSQRPTAIDIQFLQEVAFIENEEKIKNYIEAQKIERRIKFEEAKKNGTLLECECCFDSEVMVEDIIYCPVDHSFCKTCIIKYVEVEMGQGKCEFPCLSGCGEKYTLTSLQNALKPEVFSKILDRNQMEEIKAAGIEDLLHCPFCNYATIMPPEVTVLTCLNPECSKESCRLCKELNHVPLKCDEVEKSEEVKLRTYIEKKMSEALIRTCYNCQKKFVKEEGCNKMTCSCGAKMCYVCRKPVTNYDHFNGQGGTEYHKCPLYCTNDELHVDLVRRVGEDAKAEILAANPHASLKHDPTKILPQRTYDRPKPGVNRGAALAAGLAALRGVERNQNRTPGRARRSGDRCNMDRRTKMRRRKILLNVARRAFMM